MPMKVRKLALRAALHSSVMILLVYITLQTINYIRDNWIFGMSDYAQLLPTVWGFVGSTVLPPCLLFGVIIYFLARPLQTAARKLEAGGSLSPEEAEKTRRKLLSFSHYILLFNLIGFAAGYILSLGLQGRFGDLLRMEGLVIMTSNLSGGYVYASAQTALNNMIFSDLRDRLGIKEIGTRKREKPSSLRQALLAAALIFYALSFMQYQMHDFSVAKTIESDLLADLARGSIKPEQAETAFRQRLSEQFWRFSTRPSLDTSKVVLPWHRNVSLEGLQEQITLLLFVYIFSITVAIQIAASVELRAQIDALKQRIKDVVAGGGDLRMRLNLRAMDDIGELSENINQLLDQFQGIVHEIGVSASQTHTGTDSIAAVIQTAREVSGRTGQAVLSLREDLERQASQSRQLLAELTTFRSSFLEIDKAIESQNSFVRETSAAMEEMRSNIESVESITKQSRTLAETLAHNGKEGGIAATETVQAMLEIEESAKQILTVLGSLNKIASSINLLAMNAAIEAAHAGTAGAGFAVVADEVRNLANTASAETKNIKLLLAAMSSRVHLGVNKSNQTGAVLGDLVQGLEDAATLSNQIAGAMQEQSAGTRQVVNSVTQVVESTRSITKQMDEQKLSLNSMSQSLTAAFGRLQQLADNSSQQTDNVQALEQAFQVVHREAEQNLATVEKLTSEIGRFTA